MKKVVEMAVFTTVRAQKGIDQIVQMLETVRAAAAEGKFNAVALVAVEPDGTKHTYIIGAADAKIDALIVGCDLVAWKLKQRTLADEEPV